MPEFKVKDHEPSILPEGEWTLAFADEFDGEALDRTKWANRLSMMGRRWFWTEDAVELDGKGNARFFLKKDETGNLLTTQLQTGFNFMDEPIRRIEADDASVFVKPSWNEDQLQWKIGKLHENLYLHGPGYFECRCRLQQKEGWWSAFWLQSPVIGSTIDPKTSGCEIDIMESFSVGTVNGHNVFTGGYGVDKKRVKVGGMEGVDTSVFHRFGLKWDETGYTFYVDGKEDGRVDLYHAPDGSVHDLRSAFPLFILISTEVRGYRKEGKPWPESFEAFEAGDDFLVDYVRVFDRK
jgi:hypothetical protein